MRLLAFVSVGLALIVPTSVRGVPTIPDVRTLADLRGLPPVATDVGYDVHVGLADPGPDAGPYKLIYCLATPRPGPTTRSTEQVGRYELGPLDVDLDVPGVSYQRMSRERIQHGPPPTGEWLTWQSLPVDWSDGLIVRAYARTRLVLERKLGNSDRRPLYWSGFVADVNAPGRVATVERSPWPACPTFDGAAPILPVPPSAATRPAVPNDAPLPGGDTLPEAWLAFLFPVTRGDPVRLSLDREAFVLTPDHVHLPPEDDLADHWLARWWVNGRPTAVPTPKGPHVHRLQERAMQQLRLSDPPRQVRFGLPTFLGPLHAGDTIGVQLLYVNGTTDVTAGKRQLLTMMVRLAAAQSATPIPTNRLDVKLTPHLLSVAGQ